MVNHPDYGNHIFTIGQYNVNRVMNLRFKLSNIVCHVLSLRVDKIIDSIIEYNNTHDVKIHKKYITSLKYTDEKVISTIKEFALYKAFDDDSIKEKIITRFHNEIKFILDEINTTYNKIKADTHVEDIDIIIFPLYRIRYEFPLKVVGYEPPCIISNPNFLEKYLIKHLLFENINHLNIEIDM
jgi:hypothetical protein